MTTCETCKDFVQSLYDYLGVCNRLTLNPLEESNLECVKHETYFFRSNPDYARKAYHTLCDISHKVGSIRIQDIKLGIPTHYSCYYMLILHYFGKGTEYNESFYEFRTCEYLSALDCILPWIGIWNTSITYFDIIEHIKSKGIRLCVEGMYPLITCVINCIREGKSPKFVCNYVTKRMIKSFICSDSYTLGEIHRWRDMKLKQL